MPLLKIKKNKTEVPFSPGVHVAYRLYLENSTGTHYAIGNINFVGSSNIGVHFATNTEAGYAASDAFTGSSTGTSDAWVSSDAASGTIIGVMLAVPADVTALELLAWDNDPTANPEDFRVEFSDDTTDGVDGTWTTIKQVSGESAWSQQEHKVFPMPYYGSNVLYLQDATAPTPTTYSAYRILVDSVNVVEDAKENIAVSLLSFEGTDNHGTYFASSVNKAGAEADKAFSQYDVWWEAAGMVGEYVGVILNTPAAAGSVTFAYPDFETGSQASINSFRAQGSNNTTDGTDGTWADIHSVSREGNWSRKEIREFYFGPALPYSIGHKSWRVSIATGNGGDHIEVFDIEFHGGDVAIGLFASSEVAPYTIDKAFDHSLAAESYWSSSPGDAFPLTMGAIYAEPYEVTAVSITTNDPTTAPKDFTVEYSDDTTDGVDGTWTVAGGISGQTNWGVLESRTYTNLDNDIDTNTLQMHLSSDDASYTLSIPDRMNTAATLTENVIDILTVADITTRDALVWEESGYVKVLDASSDPAVASGAATYYYDDLLDVWQLVGRGNLTTILTMEEW